MLASGPLETRELGRPIRVALDAHSVGRQQTGNERYVIELGNALALREDVEVVALVNRGTPWPADTGAELAKGGAGRPEIVELRTRRPQLRIPYELPLAARRARADVLQVTYVAPPVSPVPVVTVVHDVSYEDLPELFPLRTRLRLKAFVRLAVRRSAAVVCSSSFTRDRVLSIYGANPERVHFVPAGVTPSWRRLPPDVTRERLAALDLPPRFVLAAGSDHPRKNLPRLIAALAEVRARGAPDIQLVLAGPRGAGAATIEDAIVANGAAGWVRHVGYVADDVLNALYCAADIVANTSLYEGFGLPALEALGCGAVVVAGDTTSLPEVCGDAALLVDPRDTQAIASAIHNALNNERMRARFRDEGPHQAARFGWPDSAAAMVDVYRALLNDRARRRPRSARSS